MFEALTHKLQSVFSGLAHKSKITEDNIAEAVREVRLALLEADVNFGVVKVLMQRIKEQALGEKVLKSVTPGQQFIKIVHDELVALMGSQEAPLSLAQSPAVILLCGLQGAGKTTACAKLARLLKKKEYGKTPLLVACDLQRPAAIRQLQILGEQVGVPVLASEEEKDPVRLAKEGVRQAKTLGCDVVIVDTAGRLHVDEELMEQLERLSLAVTPHEVLFVANASTGQEAVSMAEAFSRRVPITGTILTMLDGNARGGAAISIVEVTKKPLKFEGVGEKLGDLRVFNPHSMADRILGMGDTINLVKKVQEHMDEAEAQNLESKLRKASFTYEDFLQQMQMLKKMGSMKSLLKMLPGGLGNAQMLETSDGELKKVEAMILSMNPLERQERCELSLERRKRISRGSGTSLGDVNALIKKFKHAKQFMKKMPNMKNLKKMMGGVPWR